MRIALIHKAWSAVGGTERYLRGLAAGLCARGHEVELFCARVDARLPLPEGIKVWQVPWLRPSAALKALSFDLMARRRVRQRHAEAPFDVVQSLCRTTDQDIWRAGGGSHLSWMSLRGAGGAPLTDRVFVALERRACASTPVIIAVSEATAEALRSHHCLPRDRVRVLPNPVDTERFHPGLRQGRAALRAELGVPEVAPLLLLVGGGFARKGLPALLEAAALVPSAPWVVAVGADAAAGRLCRLARGLNVPLLLPGARVDVERFYGAADALVLASRYDPCANSTLEALAAGLPVVTTRANGASELLPVGAPVLEDPDDVTALARAVSEVLQPARAAQLGAAGLKVVRGLGWSAHIDAVERLYAEVVRARAERAGVVAEVG